MQNKGIFLSIKDLMKLTGSNSYNASSRQHRVIRDCLSKDKKKNINHPRILYIRTNRF